MQSIILSFMVLVFVQLVNSQVPSQACIDATTALGTNAACATAVTGTDTSTLCMGTCRDLLNDIINNCDATISSTYSTLISTFCNGSGDACTTAQTALTTNTGCTTAFATGTDTSTVCMGTCRDLFNDIISNCAASVSSAYSTLISSICNGTNTAVNCTAAANSIRIACAELFDNANTSACSGTCGAQLSAVVSACENSTDSDIQASLSTYNVICGSRTACAAATAAIFANTTCDTDTVPASVLCTGICRVLADNFINACPADDDTVIAVRDEVNRLCGSGDACRTAVNNISATCFNTLNSGSTAACSGSCVTELNAVVSACGSNSSLLNLTTFDRLCGAGAACTTARVALGADTTCRTTDSSVLCSGTCRTLADNFLSACPANDPNAIAIRATVNQLCGSGSMLKASEVITLLILAICALVF